MSSGNFLKFLLPIVTFPVLAAFALNFVVGHTQSSGWGEKLRIQCESSETPYALPYSGITQVDGALCILVSVFHASFTSVSLPFTFWFLISAVPVTAFLYVEAFRRRVPSLPIKYPIIPGILMQTATFGATIPMWWLFAILTGVTNLRPSSATTTVAQGHALAIAFGIFIGMFIPTISMFALLDPYVTAVWQFFPLFVSFAIAAHLLVRPTSKDQESGHTIISILYIASFIFSSSVHLAVVSSRLHDLGRLKAFFFPSTSVLDLSLNDDLHALHLLQWDALFGFGSAILGTLWFARSRMQLLGLLAWHIVAIPVMGPGAAITGVALWRESHLNSTEKPVDAKK
ncbi:hypothetical protein D9758_001723 [Tetrapyrgos nigripes]|uniref:Uncharacterized protein n=1 Tax=Tetrapyrgos nigripes TaxID=182062 RepID=A0A8H5GXY6_9AGAR|nr:hypothetical protein D9758_001723 [Tetrapyrgos nigripes]